ncbi:Uncharacterized membrane protein [Burkholderia sp. YR290]|nr:Uncharacterized membrane protein [Burkholderia sp. YR290]
MTSLPRVEPKVHAVWVMARNCAMSPRQFLLSYCSPVVVSLSIAGMCAASGDWVVMPFAVAELLLIAVRFLVYARHAVDYDRIELSSERLLIEHVDGPHIERYEFNPHWTRVSLQDALNPKIEVGYAGQCLLVGSHVPAHRRAIIVTELRRSLRGVTAVS